MFLYDSEREEEEFAKTTIKYSTTVAPEYLVIIIKLFYAYCLLFHAYFMFVVSTFMLFWLIFRCIFVANELIIKQINEYKIENLRNSDTVLITELHLSSDNGLDKIITIYDIELRLLTHYTIGQSQHMLINITEELN